jgi:hypothetical protein
MSRLSLTVDGNKVSGRYGGRDLEGTVSGREVTFKMGNNVARA